MPPNTTTNNSTTPAQPTSQAPAVTQQDFVMLLRGYLSKVYRDGINEILNWDVDEGGITGRFRSKDKVFEFIVNEGGVECQPITGAGRTDSLSDVYPLLDGKSELFIEGFFEHHDASFTGKRNCSSPTSYSCGKGCINNEKSCQIKSAALGGPEPARKLVAIAQQVKGKMPAPAPTLPSKQEAEKSNKKTSTESSAVAGGMESTPDAGVAASSDPNATAQSPTPPLQQKVPELAGAMGERGALEAGAATANIPVPIYSQFRSQYRRKFADSAKLAEQQAQSVKVADIGDKTHVTITTGGFSGDSVGGKRLEKGLKKIGFKNHHLVPITNEEFDVEPGISTGHDKVKFARSAMSTMLRTSLNQGYNPVSVKIASHAYAYKQKYPSAQISLVGHSAGGIAGHEAAEILKKMNVDVQVASIGSPHFGLTEATEKTMTIASMKDPITKNGNVLKPYWVNTVNGHGIEDYLDDKTVQQSLRDFLGGTEASKKRKDAAEAPAQKTRSPQLRSLILQLKVILDKAYRDGIDQFLDINVIESEHITGIFRDGRKFLEFSIKGNDIEYGLVKPGQGRSDSWLAGYAIALCEPQVRTDKKTAKPRKKSQCTKGIPCGAACIEAGDTCSIGMSTIASPGQIQKLKETAGSLKVAEESTPVSPPVQAPEPDEFDGKSIRELRAVASQKGIYRYSHMNIGELREALRVAKRDPEQQERIARTVKENRTRPVQLRRLNVGKKSPPEAALARAVTNWNRIVRIVNMSGVDPTLASAAIGAVVLGITMQGYNRLRDRYRQNLPASAKSALERASKMKTDFTPRENITFAVGGFKNEGSTGKKIQDELLAIANKPDATEADTWFRDKHHFVVVDNPEFDISPVRSSKKNPDGTYNPFYLAEVSNKAFGTYLRNYRRGRNEAAIDLAARMYAYGNRRDPATGEYSNRKKTFNVVAHGTGGNTVHEAVEILARMNGPRSRPGREVLQQVNVITLGTTDFGMMEKGIARERNITSAQDPFSFLPQRNEKWISTVRGHEINDYMRVEEVQDEIRQAFGYYSYTSYQRETRLRKQGLLRTPAPLVGG